MEYEKEGKVIKRQKNGMVKKRKGKWHKGSKEKRKKHK